VLQDSKLLPADIYRNIIGTADLPIDAAWEAARLAGLADDIAAMPMGMHTYVAEGGGGFSGGQRQRLLISRALVRRPRIIFLDEATSALDNRSQGVVTESMERLQATRIAIAHRLSTIINADRICYMESGKITEMGTYEELMKLGGKFYELARRQMA
jgi:ATP-binding cassette subfamily C protein